MLYKKNQAEKLEDSLFKQPTAEYRGAPFWAWNTRLEQKELDRQMEVLKSMGFGGAHLHPRTGLETPYLWIGSKAVWQKQSRKTYRFICMMRIVGHPDLREVL